MSTELHPRASAVIAGMTYPISDADLALDESWAPYGQAQAVAPFSDANAVAGIDPRNGDRAVITASVQGHWTTDDPPVWVPEAARVFDLGVRSRDIDYRDRTVRLQLATDEALLQDYAPLADDTTPWGLSSSLRSVVSYVLSRIGAFFGPLTYATGFEDGDPLTKGWTVDAGTSSTWSNSSPRTGARRWALYRSAGAGAGQVVGRLVLTNLVVGRRYRLGAWFRATGNPVNNARLVVSGDGPMVGPNLQGSEWVYVYREFTGTATTMEIGVAANLTGEGTAYNVSVDDLDLTVTGSDADVTPRWAVTNLMPNPAVRSIVGNWISGGSNGALTRETGWPAGTIPEEPTVTTTTLSTFTGNSGTAQGGAVSQTAGVVPYAPVQEGRTYTVYCWALSSDVAKNVQLQAQIFGSDGQVLATGAVLVPSITLPLNVWTLVYGTITMPANASRLGPFLYPAAGVQWTSGQRLRTTAWMIHEGVFPVRVPWFDGATPADTYYTYVISGPAHASATTRTPKTPGIEPEALTWSAGTSAWDFLTPLLDRANLRLFCDEQRVWRMVDSSWAPPAAVVQLNGAVSTEADDEVSREEGTPWATGVVVRYLWDDPLSGAQVRVDSAGTPGRVTVVERRQPYPGPGAAANLLAAAQRRGRVQSVVALTDYAVTPGNTSRIPLDSGTLEGRVRSVRFHLGTGLMDVGSKNQTEIPTGSIDLLPGTIDALAGTIDAL